MQTHISPFSVIILLAMQTKASGGRNIFTLKDFKLVARLCPATKMSVVSQTYNVFGFRVMGENCFLTTEEPLYFFSST